MVISIFIFNTTTMKTKSGPLLILSILYSILAAEAQSILIPRYEITLHGGGFVYQGDLTPAQPGSFRTIKPGFGISATCISDSRQAFRLQLFCGWLKGDESKYEGPAWRQQRNFRFSTPVTELSFQYIRYLPGLNPNEAGIINFSPYLFGGAGISFVKIKRDWSRFNYIHFAPETNIINGLAADINHSLPRRIITVPVGAGVRYGISEKLSFSIETAYRFIFTDYLDGFSQSANPDKNDHYHTMMIGLIYSFSNRNRFSCPVIRN